MTETLTHCLSHAHSQGLAHNPGMCSHQESNWQPLGDKDEGNIFLLRHLPGQVSYVQKSSGNAL